MKKIVLFVFALIAGSVYAQRAENAVAIHAKAGIMKGKGELIKDVASATNLGVQWYIGQRGFLIEGNAILQDFSVEHKELQLEIPYTLYGVNIMGGWSYEDLNPFFVNLKLGGFAGLYQANKGDEKESVYGSTLASPVKGFTYGAVGEVEGEITIWRNLTGVVSFSQYFYPNDKWIKWNYAIQAGFKYYL